MPAHPASIHHKVAIGAVSLLESGPGPTGGKQQRGTEGGLKGGRLCNLL